MSGVNKHDGSDDEGTGVPALFADEQVGKDASHSTDAEHPATCACPVAEETALVQAKAALTKAQMLAWTVKAVAAFMFLILSLTSFIVGYQLLYGIDPDAMMPLLQVLGYVKDIVVSLMKVVS